MLALLALPATTAAAQGQQSSRENRTGSELRQNYPNPFNPETRIAFSVGGYPNCIDPSRQYRVSLRIFNLLAQQVAVPVLQGAAAGVSGGQSLENVFLTCGEYTAYWDGKVGGRLVARRAYRRGIPRLAGHGAAGASRLSQPRMPAAELRRVRGRHASARTHLRSDARAGWQRRDDQPASARRPCRTWHANRLPCSSSCLD